MRSARNGHQPSLSIVGRNLESAQTALPTNSLISFMNVFRLYSLAKLFGSIGTHGTTLFSLLMAL